MVAAALLFISENYHFVFDFIFANSDGFNHVKHDVMVQANSKAIGVQ